MKDILKVALSLIFIADVAYAQTPVFTTVCLSGNEIFAGVKIVREGWELRSYILQVSLDNLAPSKIMLPKEISNRDIIELFPAENKVLIVMSQWTMEQGDNPQFHSYDIKTKKWKKIGETDCITYHKVKLERDGVIFSYYKYNAEGKEDELQKKVALNGVNLTHLGEFKVPISIVNNGSMHAELIGEKFKWNGLRVRLPGKEKVFRP
jgi:hypothetical protein